jgi:hypothetical protein
VASVLGDFLATNRSARVAEPDVTGATLWIACGKPVAAAHELVVTGTRRGRVFLLRVAAQSCLRILGIWVSSRSAVLTGSRAG